MPSSDDHGGIELINIDQAAPEDGWMKHVLRRAPADPSLGQTQCSSCHYGWTEPWNATILNRKTVVVDFGPNLIEVNGARLLHHWIDAKLSEKSVLINSLETGEHHERSRTPIGVLQFEKIAGAGEISIHVRE